MLFLFFNSSCGYLTLDVFSKGGVSSGSNGGSSNDNAAIDPSPLKISMSSSVESASEGAIVIFTVTLNHPSDKDITISYSTQSKGAVANLDYVPLVGTITIPAGQTQVVINVPTLSRVGFQGDRDFELTIGSVAGAQVELPQEPQTAVIKEVQIKPGMTFDLNKTPDQIPVTSFNGFIYYVNFTPETGYELWKTNGTTNTLLKDINPGMEGAFEIGDNSSNNFMEMNGYLYFAATTKDFGTELWRTDGTEAGTTMVVDLWTGPDGNGLRNLSLMAVFQNRLYFTGWKNPFYRQLYSTDGTAAGTMPVKPSLGDYSSNTGYWSGKTAELNGKLYFPGIWKLTWDLNRLLSTDGTDAGTFMVKDTNTAGWHRSDPVNVTACNGTIFFGTRDVMGETPTGDELWVSNGTTAGTSIVKDLVVGAGSSSATPVACINNRLLFTAFTNANGTELWSTDGTAAGTVIVKDLSSGSVSTDFTARHGTSNRSENFLQINNTLYFFAKTPTSGYELWKSDGTAAGTTMLKDINPGEASSWPHNFVNFEGQLAFVANDGTHGLELWKSDGTAAGTVMVMDLFEGSTSAAPENLKVLPASVFGGLSKLFLTAYTSTKDAPVVVWTQLTAQTTVIEGELVIPSEDSYPNRLFTLGQKLFFFDSSGEWGNQLWESDATMEGTKVFIDLAPNSGCFEPIFFLPDSQVNEVRYFVGEDIAHGMELWRTDGTVEGTKLIKDINPGSASSFPEFLAQTDRQLSDGRYIFAADDGVNGKELWVTDLTEAGTILLKDTESGSNSGASIDSSLNPLGGGRFLFAMTTPTYGREPWVTDGTTAGTYLLKDIYAGVGDSLGGEGPFFQVTPGKWIFSGNTSANGQELWITDGTTAGTLLLKDIYAGAGSGMPRGFTPVNGKWIFTASTAANGQELWITDGTAAGTFMVKELYAGNTGGVYMDLFRSDSSHTFVLFLGRTAANGIELWRSDGTASGTVIVRDINPGSNHSGLSFNLTPVNGGWVFPATDGTTGMELWFTDGYSSTQLKDIQPGTGDSNPGQFMPLGDKIVFLASTSVDGQALWVTDGTSQGTNLLKDIDPSTAPIMTFDYQTTLSKHILFLADDGMHGHELWSTNGTTEGTRLELDSWPGPHSNAGSFSSFTDFMGGIFFCAPTPMSGRELFVIYPP